MISKSIRINSVKKLIIVVKQSVKRPPSAKISIPKQKLDCNQNNNNVHHNDAIYCDDELINRIIKNGGL